MQLQRRGPATEIDQYYNPDYFQNVHDFLVLVAIHPQNTIKNFEIYASVFLHQTWCISKCINILPTVQSLAFSESRLQIKFTI